MIMFNYSERYSQFFISIVFLADGQLDQDFDIDCVLRTSSPLFPAVVVLLAPALGCPPPGYEARGLSGVHHYRLITTPGRRDDAESSCMVSERMAFQSKRFPPTNHVDMLEMSPATNRVGLSTVPCTCMTFSG